MTKIVDSYYSLEVRRPALRRREAPVWTTVTTFEKYSDIVKESKSWRRARGHMRLVHVTIRQVRIPR